MDALPARKESSDSQVPGGELGKGDRPRLQRRGLLKGAALAIVCVLGLFAYCHVRSISSPRRSWGNSTPATPEREITLRIKDMGTPRGGGYPG